MNEHSPIDTNWFKGRLAELGHSQRALAKLLELDPAAVSLMLRGKRKLEIKEAVALARLLDVSVDEILARFGLDVRGVRKNGHDAEAKFKFKFCPHCGERLS